jgi:hypothetical protein
MSEQKAKVQLTGLWRKQGKKGDFLAGSISSRLSLLIFPNQYKQKDSEPDYIAYIAENTPRDQQQRAPINEEDVPF